MHIPDGFLTNPVAGAMAMASAGSVAAACRRMSRPEKASAGASGVSVMGVLAAFVFCAQMFNFPISAGTSGHLLGAALATALVGPWSAMLVMTAVLLVQAFVFSDGGALALGANVFNMAVCGCLAAGLVLQVGSRLLGHSRAAWQVSVALAAWVTVVLAAAVTSVELAASGTVSLSRVLPPLLAVHAVIGLGEALLTVAALNVVAEARPDLARPARPTAEAGAEPWRLAVLLALGLLLVRCTCAQPDGLDWVATQLGFASRGAGGSPTALLPDYTLPGRVAAPGFDYLAAYVSVAVGTALCSGLMFAVGAGLRRRPES